MNKKLILGIIGGCIVLSLCGCAASFLIFGASLKKGLQEIQKVEKEDLNSSLTTPTPTTNPNFTTYSSTTYGFNMQYPKDWEKLDNYQGTVVLMRSPQADTLDLFRENVNVTTESLNGEEMSLQEYTSATINNLRSGAGITGFNIVEQGTVQMDGQDAYMVVYTGTTNGLNLKWKQAWLIRNGTAYVITFTDVEEDYSMHEKIAQDIFRTFDIR